MEQVISLIPKKLVLNIHNLNRLVKSISIKIFLVKEIWFWQVKSSFDENPIKFQFW
jgi:hypothetical protein